MGTAWQCFGTAKANIIFKYSLKNLPQQGACPRHPDGLVLSSSNFHVGLMRLPGLAAIYSRMQSKKL